MSGNETLRDFKEPFMEIECRNCPRKGRYKVSRLIEKWGPNLLIRTFIASVGMTCPKYVRNGRHDRCGIGCPQLTYMFSAAPFTEEYQQRQINREAE
jgi:hypothetical protein